MVATRSVRFKEAGNVLEEIQRPQINVLKFVEMGLTLDLNAMMETWIIH